MREQRKHQQVRVEVPLCGRRRSKDVSNSFKFLATIEGDREPDGAHIRSANGMRWQVQ